MLNYLIYNHTYFVTELNIKNHQKKPHMHSSIIIHNFYHVVFVMMSQEAPESQKADNGIKQENPSALMCC